MSPLTAPKPSALACGPVLVEIDAADAELRGKAEAMLSLYTAPWQPPFAQVRVRMIRTHERAQAAGTYLCAGRMSVDCERGGMLASTPSGAWARCVFRPECDDWEIGVPFEPPHKLLLLDVEHLLELTWSTAWRRNGWLPLHAGAIVKNDACLLLCAPSNGGKSTLTTGLIAQGWRTLGDDKLLIRLDGALPTARALHHTLNLHPDAGRWFAAASNVERFAPYSASCEKRAVPIDEIANGAALLQARPTHIAELVREPSASGIILQPLPLSAAAPMLLRRVVIPSDATIAAAILRCAIGAAAGLQPLRIVVGDDAFSRDGWSDDLEELAA